MLNHIVSFARIIASSVSPRTKAVLYNLVGGAGSADGQDADELGETAKNQDHYTALGIIARPRPPSKTAPASPDPVLAAEGVALRTGDGLVPIAYRDLRLHARFPAPKDGSIAFVGYGGGFHSLEDVDDVPLPAPYDKAPNKATLQTFYVPYQHNASGVPAKAHVITIDPSPGNESISIVHGEGMAILIKKGGKDSVVIKNKSGNAYVEVNNEGITVNGNTVINGGATIGDPEGALPAAVATPLVAYLTVLETATGALATALNGLVPGTSAAWEAAIALGEVPFANIPAKKTSVA